MSAIKDFSIITAQDTLNILQSSLKGLSLSEANLRLKRYGFNVLPESKKRSALVLFFKQFKSI